MTWCKTVVWTMSLMLLLAAAPASKPAAATKATTDPASAPSRRAADAAVSAVRAAVLVLAKEFEQSLRNPAGGAGVRESSNYFMEHPDDSVTPEAVANALQGRGGDPRTTAYVRWQLLSALPEDVAQADPAIGKQLLAAYRAAPLPVPRPGLSRQDQRKLDVFVQGKKMEQEPDIKAQLDAAVSQAARQNRVIIAYRDELYRRLPKVPEAFAAGMEDLLQRMNVVADGTELAKLVVADVREWAAVEQRPQHQMLVLARAARRLADTKGPQYYTSPSWRTSTNLFAWNKSRAGVAGADALKDLAVYLEDLAAQPALELKQ